MEIAAASTGTQPQPAPQSRPDTVISADFETFLIMLTTQLENQDPLNPVESSDFAVQLATFSGVEQQVLTNQLLDDLARHMGAGGVSAAEWVGKEVRAPTSATFDGTPVSVFASIPPQADAAQLVVVDDTGATIQRLPVDPAQSTFLWTGLGADGVPLPGGSYSFFVESFDGQQALGRTQGEVFARVSEVQIGTAGQLTLLLDSGGAVGADQVSSLRP